MTLSKQLEVSFIRYLEHTVEVCQYLSVSSSGFLCKQVSLQQGSQPVS